MPNKDNLGKEPEKRRFIQEKIIKPKATGPQVLRRFLLLGFGAVLFGFLAAVTFAVSEPLAKKYLASGETEESSSISIPKDEPETTAVPSTEETSPPETTTAVETEPLEDVVRSEVEKYEFSAEELTAMFASLNQVIQQTDKGIVAVHSVKTQVDWFNNPVETSGQYAGAVIAATRGEYLILAPSEAVQDADALEVILPGGAQVPGILKGFDQVAGMAVISVDAGLLDENTVKQLAVLTLGNSYTVKQGDVIFACGSPAGVVHSSSIGGISYVANNVQVIDGNSRLFYTDTEGVAALGTFVFNAKGQLIGWMTDDYQTNNTSIRVVRALSNYKGVLEKLSNGIPAPYLGIMGKEVPAERQAEGLPAGIYVNRAITDSPAYNAGIQNGDIITRIGETSFATMKEFQNCLDKLAAGDVVAVEVQRYGREAYASIEYEVIIGSR
ncbi:MAG: S1C family serine protease [Lachnospiraceae bacterium]|nr:S1C family serine protease [Lachnospiraceae bacterium]